MQGNAQLLLSSDCALINGFCGSQIFHKNHLTQLLRAGIISPQESPPEAIPPGGFFVVCASPAGLPPSHA
jgi:hypothetical protein